MTTAPESWLSLAIAEDKLSATVTVAPGVQTEYVDETFVRGFVAAREISADCVDDEAVTALVDAVNQAPDEPHEAVVARGRAPLHGEDGYVELDDALLRQEDLKHEAWRRALEDADDTDPDHDHADDEAIDYYAQSAFRIVARGQRLGRVVQPTNGRDGFDVFGNRLAARDGRPAPAKLDESVDESSDHSLSARNAGLFEQADNRIRVNNELAINGPVDFSTGNIDFPGDVAVAGGICDCFTVQVGGALTVGDTVEAARIIVAGDTTLRAGMTGREKGMIRIGGSLRAKFLEQTTGSIGRDLVIDKEIAQCSLDVAGRVVGTSAVLRAGELRATGACEFAEVGSDTGVATALVLGKSRELERLAAEAAEIIPIVRERTEKLRAELATLEAHKKRLSTQQAERLSELKRDSDAADNRIETLTDSLREILDSIDLVAEPTLTVHRLLQSGVRIWIGGDLVTIRGDLRGPLTLRLGPDGHPVFIDARSGSRMDVGEMVRIAPDGRFARLAPLRAMVGERASKAA